MKRPYFPLQPETPDPLVVKVRRTVRFEEVDPLGIVWHGRYASFFEDARIALGRKYGIGYMDFFRQGIVTPIRKILIDYYIPLSFDELFTIEGILHWTDAARLNIEYCLWNEAGQKTSTGCTIQILMDMEHNSIWVPPPFLKEFFHRWKSGELG